MKYVAHIEPREPDGGGMGQGDRAAGGEIEELTGVERDLVSPRSSRWIGLFLTVAVAIIGYGFVSHASDPPTTSRAPEPAGPGDAGWLPHVPRNGGEGPMAADPAADNALTITAPAGGSTITGGVAVTGGVVVVEAVAGRPLGTVHVSVAIGEAVLGWRDVDVRRAGPLELRIPVFAPAFDAPVVLRLAAAAMGGEPGVVVSRDLRLDVPSAVGFWDAVPTGIVDDAGRAELLIQGYGPRASRTIEIAMRDARGVVRARSAVPISYDSTVPGAPGGRVLGLGSFTARLWVAADDAGPWTLRAEWPDASTGTHLHLETSLPPMPAPADRLPHRH